MSILSGSYACFRNIKNQLLFCKNFVQRDGEAICYFAVSYEPECIWLISFSVWYFVYIMLKSPALGSRLNYECYPPFIPKQWGSESIFKLM